MNNIDQTLQQRGNRYGEFPQHARITQNIKRAMADSLNWQNLSDDKKESLEMVAHKIGRILNGDPEYKDSWHDITGYTKLVEDTLHDDECTTNNKEKNDSPTRPREQELTNLVISMSVALFIAKEIIQNKINVPPNYSQRCSELIHAARTLLPDLPIDTDKAIDLGLFDIKREKQADSILVKQGMK